jgi:hypothetical protein
MNATTTTHTITAENIERESYYNLVQLQRLTRYGNPIGAIKASGQVWTVEKDECGNIVRLVA